jgi:hypothetical protein
VLRYDVLRCPRIQHRLHVCKICKDERVAVCCAAVHTDLLLEMTLRVLEQRWLRRCELFWCC